MIKYYQGGIMLFHKKRKLNIRQSISKDILIQLLTIILYVYQLINNDDSQFLITSHIIFISLISAYTLYCFYAFIINKYPNHYLWVTLKVLIYILKILILFLDIREFLLNIEKYDIREFFKESIPIYISVIVTFISLTIDMSRASKYDYSSPDEETKIGVGFLWFTLNPLMCVLFLYNALKMSNHIHWLYIANMVMAIIFVLNIFAIFTKLNFNNLIILFSSGVFIIDFMYILFNFKDDKSLLFFEEGIGVYVELFSYAVISVILFIILSLNHSNHMKLIYVRGKNPSRSEYFFGFINNDENEEDNDDEDNDDEDYDDEEYDD